ncbi:uncharacterized protein A1O9_01110 [Exophiala aquamarina CBS 119918]|uniref:Uncharacterized protein n=1 Tax=Exophiala aquamarina CBS 119918 TaxID=1182545 RepID=A0A072PSQ0_9EURO|nr:uncharacterized protein A1O9_01110 [Exophiala aquamarina CBS 119918]KEF63134.1 hypothetical protein A1O9_01110 [Exophiala aquamarina CBS 119918]
MDVVEKGITRVLTAAMRPLQTYSVFYRRISLRHRRSIRTLILAGVFLAGFRALILVLLQVRHTSNQPELPLTSSQGRHPDKQPPYAQYDLTQFEPLNITGFMNDGHSGKRPCDDLRRESGLKVQKSWFLQDDMVHIARLLNDHPMVDYSRQDGTLTFEEVVSQTWTRFCGSSVWLQKHQVFLTVTRVIFYTEDRKQWPIVSFLRGQVYDRNWNELRDHTLRWQGRNIVFPILFPISFPYLEGHRFFGPEDPRVLIDEGIEDPEPLIVFNMIYKTDPWTRGMHVFRPFTNISTVLTINGDAERAEAEKNWAPFFLDEAKDPVKGGKGQPNEYLHFIYRFNPLTVLKCKIANGLCDLVYEQEIATYLPGSHDDDHGRMTGGTNLVPLPIKSKLGASLYLGFPRSHVDVGCNGESLYRPALMILSEYKGHFHVEYMSDSIDFGSAAFSEEAFLDPCGEGRILIANSIAKWDRSHGQDTLTLSLSVADATVQVLQLQGLFGVIERLYAEDDSPIDMAHRLQLSVLGRWSDAANHVLGCSIEAATNYSTAFYVSGFYKLQEAIANGY